MTGLKDPISNKIFGSQFLFYCIVVVFFNEMNACIQQEHIKQIKSDSKHLYIGY